MYTTRHKSNDAYCQTGIWPGAITVMSGPEEMLLRYLNLKNGVVAFKVIFKNSEYTYILSVPVWVEMVVENHISINNNYLRKL